jgi:aromatic ring-opening dioxygenase catalytic subunit (LigB family)
MAELVFAGGVAHNPYFPLIVRDHGPGAEDIVRLYGEVAQRLDAARPDTIIVFTTDHYNAFFEISVPIFSIGTADRAPGPSDYEQLEHFDIPLDPELARDLQTRLVAAEFDVGSSQEIALDHTIAAPLSMMVPRMDVPLVPFFISSSMRPIPTAHRCQALGVAIRNAIESSEIGRRVALIASGGFSFEVGGPRIGEHAHVGVPAPDWAAHVTELLQAAEIDALVAETTPEQLVDAGNAAGEILNWITVVSAAGPIVPDFIELQPEHGHAFAAWRIGS